MNKMNLLNLLLVAALTGCGSTNHATVETNVTNDTTDTQVASETVAQEDEIICKKEAKVGTRIKKEVCFPKSLRDKLRTAA